MEITEVSKKAKHPSSIYFCCLIFFFVHFSYYGTKLVLVLFLAEQVTKGGMGLSSTQASAMLASFMAWPYLSPIVGGWISDRYIRPKTAVSIGTCIVSIGYFIGFVGTSKIHISIMILSVIVGCGFYKGNLNTLVGNLYPKNDPRKDSAYSLTYTSINIGAMLGPFLCGLIANNWFAEKHGGIIEVYGYRYVFLLAAIVSFIGFIIFILGQKKFLKDAESNYKKKELLEKKRELASNPLTAEEKRSVLVICALSFFAMIFWIAYNQSSMTIALYTKNYVDLSIGNFNIPISWIDSYNGFLCVILGPIAAWIWMKLSKSKIGNLKIGTKISLGFLFLAIAFVFMIVAISKTGEDPSSGIKVSIIWIILFLTFQSIGEVCFTPIGYSIVNRLAPQKALSLFMGVWYTSLFVGKKLAGYMQIVIDQIGLLNVFIIIPIILIVFSVILSTLSKKLEEIAQ